MADTDVPARSASAPGRCEPQRSSGNRADPTGRTVLRVGHAAQVQIAHIAIQPLDAVDAVVVRRPAPLPRRGPLTGRLAWLGPGGPGGIVRTRGCLSAQISFS